MMTPVLGKRGRDKLCVEFLRRIGSTEDGDRRASERKRQRFEDERRQAEPRDSEELGGEEALRMFRPSCDRPRGNEHAEPYNVGGGHRYKHTSAKDHARVHYGDQVSVQYGDQVFNVTGMASVKTSLGGLY